MPEELKLTPEQERQQLATLEAEAKRLREKLAGGVEEHHGKALTDAELFASLSGQEKGQLARENPERFSQLAAAYRTEGEKKLFNRSLVP
jgi:hypothetical protein